MRMNTLRIAFFSVAIVGLSCSSPSKECTSLTDCAVGHTCKDNKCVAKSQADGGDVTGGGSGSTGGGTGGGTGSTGGGTQSSVGENCADPFVVTTANATFEKSLQDARNDFTLTLDTAATCAANSASTSTAGDHVYRATVPAGERLTASLSSPDFESTLNVLSNLADCGQPNADGSSARVGVVCASHSNDLNLSTVTFTNTESNPAEVYLVVDGYAQTGGTYTLTIDTRSATEGDDCNSPLALIPDTVVDGGSLGTDSSFANDYVGEGTDCSVNSTGIDRVYSLTIPAGQRANIVVRPSATLDTSLSLVTNAAACGTRTCLANSNNGYKDGETLGQPDTLAWVNADANPQTVLLIVDSAPSQSGTFTLEAFIEVPTTGETCEAAVTVPVTAGNAVSVMGQTTAGYANNIQVDTGGTCRGAASSANGPDRVYSVTVGAGQLLQAEVVPESGFDPIAYIVAAPAATCQATQTACLDHNGGGVAGREEYVSYRNCGTFKACFGPGYKICTDLKSDPQNCNSCGYMCGPDFACVNGNCEFGVPNTFDGGVDVGTTPVNVFIVVDSHEPVGGAYKLNVSLQD